MALPEYLIETRQSFAPGVNIEATCARDFRAVLCMLYDPSRGLKPQG